jgi:hypothetical protein
MKSGNLNFLEPSGPLQACKGTAFYNIWSKRGDCGPGSAVGIATGYGLDGPGIFHTRPDRPWGPSSLLYNGYRVFPGGKERLGRDADPSSPSSFVVKKE